MEKSWSRAQRFFHHGSSRNPHPILADKTQQSSIGKARRLTSRAYAVFLASLALIEAISVRGVAASRFLV